MAWLAFCSGPFSSSARPAESEEEKMAALIEEQQSLFYLPAAQLIPGPQWRAHLGPAREPTFWAGERARAHD